jgi:dolichyldiphosphatase
MLVSWYGLAQLHTPVEHVVLVHTHCTLTIPETRYYLRYHTATQILAGLAIGSMFGTTYYIFIEELPTRFPSSLLGQLRSWLVGNPISTWIRLKDGWAVYPDGGQEAEWQMWRKEWESRTQIKSKTA